MTATTAMTESASDGSVLCVCVCVLSGDVLLHYRYFLFGLYGCRRKSGRLSERTCPSLIRRLLNWTLQLFVHCAATFSAVSATLFPSEVMSLQLVQIVTNFSGRWALLCSVLSGAF